MGTEKLDVQAATGVKIGVVPVQEGFGNFYPIDGKLPRNGKILTALEMMDKLGDESEIKMNVVQIPVFPKTEQGDIDELIQGLKDRGYEPQLILMVDEGDPMNPKDEDIVARDL